DSHVFLLLSFLFLLMLHHFPGCSLFSYTTLFRSPKRLSKLPTTSREAPTIHFHLSPPLKSGKQSLLNRSPSFRYPRQCKVISVHHSMRFRGIRTHVADGNPAESSQSVS